MTSRVQVGGLFMGLLPPFRTSSERSFALPFFFKEKNVFFPFLKKRETVLLFSFWLCWASVAVESGAPL